MAHLVCNAGTMTSQAVNPGKTCFQIYMIHLVPIPALMQALCIVLTTWQLDPDLPKLQQILNFPYFGNTFT